MERKKAVKICKSILLLLVLVFPVLGQAITPTESEIRARIGALAEDKLVNSKVYQKEYWSLPKGTNEIERRALARGSVVALSLADLDIFYSVIQESESNLPGDQIEVDIEPYSDQPILKSKQERIAEKIVGVGGAAVLIACVVWIASRFTQVNTAPIYWGLIAFVIIAIASAALRPI